MREEDIYKKLFGFGSSTTYYSWKKEVEKRQVMSLLEKYFTKEDLIEFLETGKILKYENIPNIDHEIHKILTQINLWIPDPSLFYNQLIYVLNFFVSDINKRTGLQSDIKSFVGWLKIKDNRKLLEDKNIDPIDFLFVLTRLREDQFTLLVNSLNRLESAILSYEIKVAKRKEQLGKTIKDHVKKQQEKGSVIPRVSQHVKDKETEDFEN